jgi:hypothetical protein
MNCLRYIKNINSEWFLQENYVSEWWKILDVDFDDNTDIKVVQKYIKKYAIGYCNEINIGNILNTNKYAIMFKKDEFKFWSQIENKFIIIKEDSLIGKKYGRLTVIERVENYISPNGQTAIRLKCICDCGNEKIVVKGSLINGLVKSCGCLVQETSLKNIKKARDSNNFKNRNQEEFVKEKFTTHITLNKIYKTWNINIKVNNITI